MVDQREQAVPQRRFVPEIGFVTPHAEGCIEQMPRRELNSRGGATDPHLARHFPTPESCPAWRLVPISLLRPLRILAAAALKAGVALALLGDVRLDGPP